MANAYRGDLPKPTTRGDVRPEVGGKRFTVGNVHRHPQGLMRRRLDRLRDLFDQQCQQHGIDFWAGWILPFAYKIAKGESVVFPVSEYATNNPGQASEEALVLDRLQQLGVEVVADDEATIRQGEQQLKSWIDERIRAAVGSAISETAGHWDTSENLSERITANLGDPAALETKTFHEALRFYASHLKKTGKRQDNGELAKAPQNLIRWSNLLTEKMEDFPLYALKRDKLEEVTAHWRNRPVSDKTNARISSARAEHMLDTIYGCLRLIDESDAWKWSLPAGWQRINRTPVPLDIDRQKNRTRRVSNSVYTPEQLAEIANRLDTFGRMTLGVMVNCAMQPAEVGRIETPDFYTVHPETGEAGNWILFDRPKTHEYGEWTLWAEVAELVKWGIERVERLDSSGKYEASPYYGVRLITDANGKCWYREKSAKPEYKFSKWWNAKPVKNSRHCGIVTKMNLENPDFPRHTIIKLRKILPNLIRPKWGSEVADLVNARTIDAHGRHGGRETDRYADRRYDDVAKALRDLEPTFRPFLDALRIE